MRISKPLIGAAAGAAVLGATLAYGLTTASAATTATGGTQASHVSSATSSTAESSSAPAKAAPKAGHKCTHMSGPGGTSTSAVSGAF